MTVSRRASRGVAGRVAGPSTGILAAVVMVFSFLTLVTGRPASGLSINPFTIAFQTNVNGAISLIGNNLETCPTSDSACAAGKAGTGSKVNNNDFNMVFLNADPAVSGNPAFFSSSGASFTLPAGGQLLYAQLSWGARTVAGTNGQAATGPTNQMRFKLPGSTTYQTVTATSIFSSGVAVQSNMYHAFADVTNLVKANPGGVSGQYWGANVAAATGVDRYAGWSLSMVYSDPAQPLRNLTVYNGFAVVQSGDPPQNVTVSGFLAPQFGAVNAQIGVVAYEGDLSLSGDQMRLNNVPLSDAVVPANNFFDSGNSSLGGLNTARTPADVDMFGFDVKSVAANNVLANGATSATIALTTSGDAYSSGVITSSINLNSPQFPPQSKFVTDLTGGNVAHVGDTLEYLIDYPNTGGDGAANSVLTDPLPAGLTYLPGSLQYATGTVTGGMGPFASLTDRAGDDNGEFSAANNTVTARLGAGANATTGGLIKPGDRVQVKFRAVVGASLAGTTISNTDVLDYTLATLGSPVHRPGLPATIPVAAEADLAITKTASPSPLAPGQSVSYVVTVRNNGPNDAANVTVTDNLPPNLTFGAATPSQGGPCTFASGAVTCPMGTVANGVTVTVGITASLGPDATGISSLTNAATVTSTTDDPNPANNSATAVSPVAVSADVAAGIAVSSPAGSVTPGNPVQLTLTATNNGPSTAQGVVLSEDLSPLLAGSVIAGPGCSITATVLTCLVGTLAPGATFTATIQATVPPGTTATSIPATDTVSSSSPDRNPANDTATTTIPVGPPAADVSTTKVPSPAGPAVAGTAQGWTLTVGNAGPSTAQDVMLSDPATTGYTPTTVTPSRGTCSIVGTAITCSFGPLIPGGVATVTVTGVIGDGFTGTLSNAATASSTTPDPVAGNNTGSASVLVNASADVAITKTATQAVPGTNITFTLSTTNNGPSTAQAVQVSDPLPAGFTFVSVSGATGCTTPLVGTNGTITCPLGDIPNDGSTHSIQIVALIPASFTGSITNTATASSPTPDPLPGNNTASFAVSAAPSADLSIQKTATTNPLVAGGPVTYQITVTNTGPSAASQVSMTDNLPVASGTAQLTAVSVTPPNGLGFTCSVNPSAGSPTSVACSQAPGGSLASGATAVFTVTGLLLPTLTVASMTNSATVTSTTLDPTTSNNTDRATSDVVQQADLSVTKVPDVTTVPSGGLVTYTLTVTNNGPSTAAQATFLDLLPAGESFVSAVVPPGANCALQGLAVTCTTVGPLQPGDTLSGSITLQAAPSLPAGTALTNTASVSSPTSDPNLSNNSAPVTVTTTTSADISVTKTIVPDPIVAGGTATYNITVVDHGPSDAQAVTAADTVPAGLTVTDASPSQGTCSISGQTVTCAIGTMAADSTVTIAVSVSVPASATGPFANTATASSATTPDPDLSNNTSSINTNVTAQADLRMIKTASAATVNAGSGLTYTLTVVNAGPSNATAPVVTDTLPPGLSFDPIGSSAGCAFTAPTVTCTQASLPAGQAASFVVAVNLDPGLPEETLTNNASVTSPTPDPDLSNNADSAPVTVTDSADLTMVKSADVTAPSAGTPITYNLQVSNGGPSTAPSITVTDVLPANLSFVSGPPGCTAAGQTVTCTGGALAPATVTNFQIVVDVAPDAPPGPLSNAASANSPVPDPNPTDNTSTNTVTVQRTSDLAIVKTVTSGPVVAGQPVTYALTVTNAGPSDAANVVITDTAPPGTTWASAALPGGACTITGADLSCTLTNTMTVAQTVAATVVLNTPSNLTGTLTNTADATSDSFDPNISNNPSTVVSPVTTSADLVLLKTVSDPTPNVGDTITYTVTVVDDGPSDATGVTVTDLLPAGTTFVAATASEGTYDPASGLWAAGTVTTTSRQGLTITAQVVSANPSANTASISHADQFDPNPANNTDTASVNPQHSDLALLKTVSDFTPNVGDTITYTVTLVNNGPSNATSVEVSDPLPAGLTFVSDNASPGSYDPTTGLWTIGTVPTTAEPVLTIQANVASPNPTTNTASIATADQFDPDPGNNTASATETPQQADLSVTKTVSNATPDVGDMITYTVGVTNRGPDAATNVTLTDLLPAGLTLVSATPSQGTYNPTTGLWTAGAVPTTTEPTLTIQANVVSPNTQTNTATISHADQFDPVTNNNTAAATETPQRADLVLLKTVSDPTPNVGDTITYTVTVVDDGPSDATGVTVTDLLPAGTTFVAATASEGTYDPASGLWAAGTVTTTTRQSLTITAQVVSANPSANTASISHADQFDPNPANNTDTASVNPQHSDLALLKTVSDFTPNVGDTITYTVTLVNNGPSNATSVEVSDPLPAGLTFVSDNASPGSYDPTTGLWTIGTVPTTAEPVLTIQANVASPNPTTNTASIATADQFDPDPGNNTASATETPQQADLSVTKTVSNATPDVGDMITYTVGVTNRGPDAATNVTVMDLLPAGLTFLSANPSQGTYVSSTGLWTLGTVDSTAPASLIIQARVVSSNPQTNTATISHADQFDPVTNNNTAAATETPLQADLAVKIALDTSTPLAVGQPAAYTVTVTNNGPDPADMVKVVIPLPASLTFISAAGPNWICSDPPTTVTCTTPSAPAGQTLPPISLVTEVGGDAFPSVAVEATVSSATLDPDLVNNASTAAAPVAAQADLSITKTHEGDVLAGSHLTYNLSVTNHGPTEAPGPITVTDPLPAGLSFVSAMGPGWSCAAHGSDVGCTRSGGLANGATTDITLVVAVGPTAPTVSNTATESDANADDPTPSNNSSTDSATVTPVANLKLTKTLQGSQLENGQQAAYQLAVTNRGPSEAAGPVTVTDPLPSGLTYVAAHGTGWTCSAAGPLVTCTHADPIFAADVSTIALTVKVTAATGTVTNAATVSGPTMQTDPSGDRAAITSPVVAAPPAATTTEPATTSTTASPNQIAAATPASATPSSRTLAKTGASPATLLRITYILEAAGIALVTAASFGRRRRNGRQPAPQPPE